MIKQLLHNRDNIILLEKFKESRGMRILFYLGLRKRENLI